ncbi:MAG: class I SAM-dependent methyltransferase [Acidimicrobiales bacterium]
MAWDRLRSSYDRVAARYEETFLDELRGKARDRELLEAFGSSVGDPVVEIGCGPGQIGAFVRHRGRVVLGLDLSVEMVALARHRLDAVAAADMRALPFGDARVGGLLAFYSLIHLRRAELAAALAEFRRVLRPGGRVLFSAHEGQGQFDADEFLGEPVPFVATLFELDELVAATVDAGLEIRIAERRAPYAGEHPTTRLYVDASRPEEGRPGR